MQWYQMDCGYSKLHLTVKEVCESECYSDHISGDCGRVTRDWGSIGQLVIGPIKFNAHESTMVLIPGLHLSLFCEEGFTCVIPNTLFTILVSFGHLPCDAVYCAPFGSIFLKISPAEVFANHISCLAKCLASW